MVKEKAVEQTLAIGFVRVANNTQESVNAMVAQQNAIYAYADTHNIKIVKWFEGDGTRDDLESLLNCIDELQSARELLALDSNRLARDFNYLVEIMSELKSRGIFISYVNTTASDNFLRKMYVTMAQMDNDSRSELIKERMARKAKQGYHLSKPPLGYSQGATKGIHEVNNDGRALQKGFQDFNLGKITESELREEISRIYYPLSASEYKTINKEHFEKIVRNSFYSGFVEFRGNIYKGLHEALLTPEEQEKLISLLNS
jgi:DNA invertase Pin-like site-specific DNA recombinase